MDRERFDELARLLATTGSRRKALGALFSVAILGHDPEDADAKNGKKGRKDRNKNNKNRNNNRNKNNDNNQNDAGAAQRQGEPEVQAEEVAAVPETDDVPEVQAEAAPGGGKRKAKGRGKGKGKGKGRNKKQSGSRDSQTQAEAVRCCGTRSCNLPTSGANAFECNFAGKNLSGRTMTGVNFGRIDGRKTNFNNSNVKGSNFGEACLQGATFRGANVSSTNFGKACLFFADFTGARNLNVTVNFSTALLCGTILPDGSVSDRDCGRATACCAACDAQRPCTGDQICCNGRCVEGECCAAGDCDDQVCQTKNCVGNECQYTPVTGGTCPAPGGGTGTCCNGVCCRPNETCVGGQCRACNAQTCANGCCDAQGICRQSSNTTCGVGGEPCTNCPEGNNCVNGDCVCNAASCPNGCCSNGPGNAGVCRASSDTTCGVNGVRCVDCPDGNVCNAQGICVCNANSCPAGCCSNGPGNAGVCRASGNDTCGINGVQCVDCPDGNVCNAQGVCVCTANSCPTGCCSNGPGNAGVCRANGDDTCGINGVRCVDCPSGTVCNAQGQCVCNQTSCPNGCCDTATGPCITPPTDQNCGTNGAICVTCPDGTDCVNGSCGCNADSCPGGCCDTAAGPCISPPTTENCGSNGVICITCPSGTVCNAQGQCICTAASCQAGCCSNGPGNVGTCRPSGVDNCGINGVLCVDCPNGNACNAQGVCVCTAASCSTGCCSAGPGNPGTCQVSSDTTCGTGGEQCTDCPDGNQCVAGDCVCTAASCSTGCCSAGPGNPGICRVSGNDTCGTGGELCVDCPTGNVCVAGDCVCNAASCPNGCCSNGPGNAGTCQTSGNDTCGINGVLCVDCPSGAPFCNASGTCVACLTPANCGTPPTCRVNTCTNGVCGTAPADRVQTAGCNAAGQICCNGVCVVAQANDCPICCVDANVDCPPSFQCVGSGACEVAGVNVCVGTGNPNGKCCRDN